MNFQHRLCDSPYPLELHYVFPKMEPGMSPLPLHPTHPVSLPPGDRVSWLETVWNMGQGTGR